MLKIRRPLGRLIFYMGIAIPGKTVFLIETAPCSCLHDVIKWKYFPRYWPFGGFPAQRPVTQSFDVFFDVRLNKRLSKNREVGDLRHYRAHYDVSVM